MNFRDVKGRVPGLGYFKDKEREKPKMNFELQVCLLERVVHACQVASVESDSWQPYGS